MQECFKIECDTRGTGTVLVRQENEGGYVLMCVLYTALCHIWQKSLVMWMYTFICFPFRFKYVTTTRSSRHISGSAYTCACYDVLARTNWTETELILCYSFVLNCSVRMTVAAGLVFGLGLCYSFLLIWVICNFLLLFAEFITHRYRRIINCLGSMTRTVVHDASLCGMCTCHMNIVKLKRSGFYMNVCYHGFTIFTMLYPWFSNSNHDSTISIQYTICMLIDLVY